MWHVYILKCKDGTLYTGVTNDVAGRVKKHNLGKAAKYTRSRTPVELVYKEAHPGKIPAMRREFAIKQMTRAEKLVLVVARKSVRVS